MKKKWVVLLMAVSFLLGSGGAYAFIVWKSSMHEINLKLEQTVESSNEKEINVQDFKKVEKAYQLIVNNYVEPIDREQLIEGAIQGMLATLEDPHSVYMDKETVKQFNESLDSTFEGIGAEVSQVDGKIIIVTPFKNSPAEKAGLKPNDQILSIDGESAEGLDLFEATLKIRGKKGTTVKLEILRNGLSEPIVVEVKRDKIPQITVNSQIKTQYGKTIGYLEITSFGEDTAKEFKTELAKLEKTGIDGLVIDVRGNPGGLLPSVEEIVKEFVTNKRPYVQIEKRNGEKLRYFSSLKKKKDYPIAVLIDKGSASASEILAAALKEVEGYTLIGEKTFGKGTVQQAIEMGDGSNIKLTIYKWLTPNGNWIHNKGVSPDIEIAQPDIFRMHPLQIEKPLEKDTNSEQVKNAQLILRSLGFEPGRLDGYFSETTETAVKAFQHAKGLEVHGKIDKETAQSMEMAILEETKKEKNDLQLQTALRYLVK